MNGKLKKLMCGKHLDKKGENKMEMTTKKKISVEVQLSSEETKMMYNFFNLLETIQNKLYEEGIQEDKDIFTIYWKNDFDGNVPHEKSLEELEDFLGKFDDFLL